MLLLKTGLKLLYSTLAQFIFVVIAYEYYAAYKLKLLGQAQLDPIQNINSWIWLILVIELVISLAVINYGLRLINKGGERA